MQEGVREILSRQNVKLFWPGYDTKTHGTKHPEAIALRNCAFFRFLIFFIHKNYQSKHKILICTNYSTQLRWPYLKTAVCT
jgi:hypothetical protein